MENWIRCRDVIETEAGVFYCEAISTVIANNSGDLGYWLFIILAFLVGLVTGAVLEYKGLLS